MKRPFPFPHVLILAALFVAPVAADEDEGTPLDRYFRGQVVELDDDVLTLEYDLADEKQMQDWYESVPFPIARREGQGVEWVEETIEIRGNTGIRHVAHWKGDIEVRCRMTLQAVKDVGGLLVPAEDTPDFATFTLAEHYFHEWDRQQGGQNSIIKFGEHFRKRGFGGDFIGFRYIARKPPAKPLVRGRTVPVAFGLRRSRLFLDVQGEDLEGRDLRVRLKVHRPGFYAVRGSVRVDDIRIRGELDPDWMRSCGVAPRLAEGPEGPEGE